MKILQVIPSYKPAYIYGGPIQSVSALCEGLVRAGHEVTVYTTNANGPDDLNLDTGKEYSVGGVRVFYFKRITGDHSNISPSLLWRLWKTISRFDVVHIQSWWNGVAIPALVISLFRGKKVILSPRGSLTSYTLESRNRIFKKWIHSLAGRRLLLRSIIHVTTDGERYRLRNLVRGVTTIEIPNILETPRFIESPERQTDSFKLLFLGRIDPVKRLDLLFNVMSGLSEEGFKLVLVGDGDQEYIKQLSSAYIRLGSCIEWAGPLYGDDKWSKLREADLMLLPSFSENFGNVIVEAVSQGTAVLVSPEVGVSAWVKARDVGWVLEAEPEAWRRQIDIIAREGRAKLDRIREQGNQVVQSDFGVNVLIPRYEAMYRQIALLQTGRS